STRRWWGGRLPEVGTTWDEPAADAIRRALRARMPRTALGAASGLRSILREGRPDGIDQGVAPEWLSEEGHGAGLKRSPARLLVAMRRQDDRGNPNARGAQMREQVQATHPGHAEIQHETAGVMALVGVEEGLSGGEHLGPEPDRRQQIPD